VFYIFFLYINFPQTELSTQSQNIEEKKIQFCEKQVFVAVM